MQNLPLITAHSGSDGTPDNTMEYIRYALTTGADTLEIDIRRDNNTGVLFLSHDSIPLLRNEPLLSEVFSVIAEHPSMKVNCDLKQAGMERDVYECGRDAGLAGRLVYSGTVDPYVWNADPDLVRDTELYINIEEIVPHLYQLRREIPDYDLKIVPVIVETCRKCHVSVLNSFEWILTKRMIEALRSEGIGLSVWTVNDKPDIAWFLLQNVHGITTRRPHIALELRDKLAEGDRASVEAVSL